jgi:hypothetical protein
MTTMNVLLIIVMKNAVVSILLFPAMIMMLVPGTTVKPLMDVITKLYHAVTLTPVLMMLVILLLDVITLKSHVMIMMIVPMIIVVLLVDVIGKL